MRTFNGSFKNIKGTKDILPNETLLCNWCYLWDECSAKVDKNQSKIAD